MFKWTHLYSFTSPSELKYVGTNLCGKCTTNIFILLLYKTTVKCHHFVGRKYFCWNTSIVELTVSLHNKIAMRTKMKRLCHAVPVEAT